MPTYSNSKHWQICLFIPESENSQDTVCWVTLLWGAQGFMIFAGWEVDVRYLRPTGLKDSAEKLLRFSVDLYNSVHFCLRGNWGRCSRVTWSFHRYLNCETLRELATWGKNIQCINATLIPAGHRFEVRCSSIPLPEIQDQIKLELEPFNMKITVAKWGCAYSCLDPSCEELTCLLACRVLISAKVGLETCRHLLHVNQNLTSGPRVAEKSQPAFSDAKIRSKIWCTLKNAMEHFEIRYHCTLQSLHQRETGFSSCQFMRFSSGFQPIATSPRSLVCSCGHGDL